jgi:hypothetical protein
MSETNGHFPEERTGTGYEKRDVNLAKIILSGLGIIILIVVSLVLLSEYFVVVKEEHVYNMVLKPESTTLRDLRAKEAEALNSYKLLDSAKGVYRIPISRAMVLLADEDFQAREGD